MRMYDLIEKKKHGGVLSSEEITWMISSYVAEEIPDYQMSAMLMAIYFQGLNAEETLALTLAMRDSGDVMDLSPIHGIKVDKHSTGGVGDKTTLVVAPLVASLGVPVAKMSGRGLGHTGGTIDKLECFRGFTTELSTDRFFANVNQVGMAIAGQTASLAPADKLLYALRDVTATVDQMSLIASSIMSKKLASGSDAIVLDVKTGNGAFMKDKEDAIALAKEMVRIGKMAGKKMAAVVTDMSQPLGHMVGNSLEVIEAVQALSGQGPKDLMDDVYELGAYMCMFGGVANSRDEAVVLLKNAVSSGGGLKKFAQFVEAQGGDSHQVYDISSLPVASQVVEISAGENGYISEMKTQQIGQACMTLGGGRETKDSKIDLSVGIELVKKTGDAVTCGDVIAKIYGNDTERIKKAKELVEDAYLYSDTKVEKISTIHAVITE